MKMNYQNFSAKLENIVSPMYERQKNAVNKMTYLFFLWKEGAGEGSAMDL